jgi:hypothetical protein
MQVPFPITPELTAITRMYRNQTLIADDVLPRFMVSTPSFRYSNYALAEGFTIPDVRVGRKSPPNQVEFTRTETTSSCDDHALDDSVPQLDIDAAPVGYDPLGRAAEGITDLLMLAREKRAADLVFNTATYPAANKSTLSGTSQWSDYTNSNPVSAILTALDSMVIRPNVAVFGRAVFTILSQHPKILSALYGPGGTTGIGTAQAMANLFGLDQILVGQGYLNTAKKGQTAAIARVWGKSAAFLVRNAQADTNRGITFGMTAQWGPRIAGRIQDVDVGMRGGVRVRVGESTCEFVVASDAGYLFDAAVA